MTIGARLTVWYAGVLLLSLLVLGGGLYYELVVERSADQAAGRPREPVVREINEVVFFYAAPAVVVALAGGWWLTRKALSPLRRLTASAEQISAQNLRERLNHSGNGDELDRLTEVFNAMLARLEESFAREREFTLHASHELKTPLTIMHGEIETALRDEGLTVSQRELLANHLDEIQRLAAVVDSLSLLAKADAGLIKLRLERVQLDQLVKDVFDDAQMLGTNLGLTVTLDPLEAVPVRGDRHRLRQLLLALADNAIKYNHAGGRVHFILSQVGNEAELIVINTGPGIPPEKLSRVFDRFYRADPAHGTAQEGSGLGLTIAQWIVAAHGGTIHLSSKVHGETAVTVRLPAFVTGVRRQ